VTAPWSAIGVEHRDGVWWLVNAAGERFVSLGVNHVQGDCWLAPYNRQWSLEKYGPDLAGPDGEFNPNGAALPRLMANVLATMGRWQFNTLGVHTAGVPPRLFKDDVYYVVDTNTQDLAPRCAPDAASPWWRAPRLGQEAFPDIFADSFAAAVEQRVRAVCELHRGQRNLIGYAFADIPRWYLYRGEMQQHGGQARPPSAMHPWVDDLRRLGPAAPGKRQWIDVLRGNHASPEQAARAYGAAFRTWEQAGELTDWPAPADAAASAADCAGVLVAMVERWYELHCGCLREHDDGHLILGDKLHSPADIPPAVLETVARHVDVLFLQWYAPFEQQRDTLLRLHAATGKPILNGDSSFAVAKPPHQTRVKGYMVDSLAAVGRHYHDYVRGIMSLPFMLGWHHCGWVEQWDGARAGSGLPLNENGLMDPFERPYEAVVERVIEANSQAAAWHAGAGSVRA
jgi:hypothetical protein